MNANGERYVGRKNTKSNLKQGERGTQEHEHQREELKETMQTKWPVSMEQACKSQGGHLPLPAPGQMQASSPSSIALFPSFFPWAPHMLMNAPNL